MGHGPLSGVSSPNDRIWETPTSPTGDMSRPSRKWGLGQFWDGQIVNGRKLPGRSVGCGQLVRHAGGTAIGRSGPSSRLNQPSP